MTTSAELYDPVAGAFTATGSMATPRAWHSATLLLSGKVLIVGGSPNAGGVPATSAELYDPAAGAWTTIPGPQIRHRTATACLLQNGKVLLAGSPISNDSTTSFSVELFDPGTNTWSYAADLPNARALYQISVLLPNGRVYLVGGQQGSVESYATTLSYNPINDTWTKTPFMDLSSHWNPTIAPLANGSLLAAGGFLGGVGEPGLIGLTYFLNPTTGVWSQAFSLGSPRWYHTLTLLPNGKVLAAGGLVVNGTGETTTSTEIYDPVTKSWTWGNPMNVRRSWHTATVLTNGKVLVVGGGDSTTAEIVYF